MVLDYSKWDHLEDSDEEDTKNLTTYSAREARATTFSTLITVPWDPFCEKARWALEKHGITYQEHAYPWGIHIFATGPYWTLTDLNEGIDRNQKTEKALSLIPVEKQNDPSDTSIASIEPKVGSITAVPILVAPDNQVFKQSITGIMMYCFSKAFSTSVRLYRPQESLQHDLYFDRKLAPAARIFFLNIVSTGGSEFLSTGIRSPRLRKILELGGAVILKYLLRWYYRLYDQKTIQKAKSDVRDAFGYAEKLLESREGVVDIDKIYFCGTAWTAADLAFSCHAMWCLFPNEKEKQFASLPLNYLGFTGFPTLHELPEEDRAFVLALRESKAGKYALSILKRERKKGISNLDVMRKYPSIYEARENPWWVQKSNRDIAILAASISAGAFISAGTVVLLVGGLWNLLVVILLLAVLAGSAIASAVALFSKNERVLKFSNNVKDLLLIRGKELIEKAKFVYRDRPKIEQK